MACNRSAGGRVEMTILVKKCCLSLAAALLATMTIFGAGPAAAQQAIPNKNYSTTGMRMCINARDMFTGYRSSPRITAYWWELGEEYYDADNTGIDSDGRLCVQRKSDEDLEAMTNPPARPYFEARVKFDMRSDHSWDWASNRLTIYHYW